MKNFALVAMMAAVAVLAAAFPASADFAGQTILGPLGPGSSVMGDTTGATDDNDGWFSGGHIFDIWDGGDDVWALEWPGGDMELEMLYNNAVCDPDLFLYAPTNLDESILDSYVNTGVENIYYPGAEAGTYYILVDGTPGAEGAYTLNVSPEPGTLMLLGVGMVALSRRRR